MKHIAYALAAVALIACGATAFADATMKPTIFTSDALKWMPMPGTGPGPSTVSVAVLEGDPSKPGPFVIRLKMTDGTKLPVHYHDDVEHVTIISGTFMLGVGTTFDESKMMAGPAGTYCVLPAGLRHYGMAKGDTVVQVAGNGPFAMKMDKMPDATH